MAKRTTASSMAGREFAFKFLYQWIVQGGEALPECSNEIKIELEEFEDHAQNNPDNEGTHLTLDSSARNMAQEICKTYRDNRIELSELVDKHNKSKSLDTMTKLFAIMGCAEILYLKTPPKVVINEYVEICKKYGAPGAHGVINAILDKVVTK